MVLKQKDLLVNTVIGFLKAKIESASKSVVSSVLPSEDTVLRPEVCATCRGAASQAPGGRDLPCGGHPGGEPQQVLVQLAADWVL